MSLRKSAHSSFKSSPRSFIVLVTVVGLLFGAVAPALADHSSPKPQQAHFEIWFIKKLIDHHHMAMEMHKLCQEKAVHSELKDHCNMMHEDAMQHMGMLQMWLKDWYGITYEPRMSKGQMIQLERLKSLSGDKFEMQLMKMMIRHLQQTAILAKIAVNRAHHQELKDLAQHIIEMHPGHIEQLQMWLCEWFGKCQPVHKMRPDHTKGACAHM